MYFHAFKYFLNPILMTHHPQASHEIEVPEVPSQFLLGQLQKPTAYPNHRWEQGRRTLASGLNLSAPVFVNKALLAHGQDHLFTHPQWGPSALAAESSRLDMTIGPTRLEMLTL